MNSRENLKLSGKVKIVLTGEDGNIKDTREIKNLVVQNGLRWITESMAKTTVNSPAAMTHMAVGNSTTAAGDTDSALLGTSTMRKGLTSTQTNIVPSGGNLDGKGNIIYTATFASTDNFSGVTGTQTSAITEAGIFNDATTGTMLCRTTFPVVNKGTSDTMTVTWTITLDAVTS